VQIIHVAILARAHTCAHYRLLLTVLKTVVARVTVGSNPTPTAGERPLTR
jgi:hypothetical protein